MDRRFEKHEILEALLLRIIEKQFAQQIARKRMNVCRLNHETLARPRQPNGQHDRSLAGARRGWRNWNRRRFGKVQLHSAQYRDATSAGNCGAPLLPGRMDSSWRLQRRWFGCDHGAGRSNCGRLKRSAPASAAATTGATCVVRRPPPTCRNRYRVQRRPGSGFDGPRDSRGDSDGRNYRLGLRANFLRRSRLFVIVFWLQGLGALAGSLLAHLRPFFAAL